MGEKLASLNLEENDKALDHDNEDCSHNAKPLSADSVFILLKQALRADDRALLIDCLYRQDDKVFDGYCYLNDFFLNYIVCQLIRCETDLFGME